MQQFSNTHGDLVVVARGKEVMAQLAWYAKDLNLKSAWMSGLGGAGRVTLGFYDIETKAYEWKEFNEPMEILNLTGNLAWVDGEPFWHVHGTFSGRDLKTVGGHVKELVVSLTCEILITPLDTPLARTFDDETGLKLLEQA
jgi:predicted DNA-binding protein with PD1-like motif